VVGIHSDGYGIVSSGRTTINHPVIKVAGIAVIGGKSDIRAASNIGECLSGTSRYRSQLTNSYRAAAI
jgi:hypothetical protein